jgi:hypothetical protein
VLVLVLLRLGCPPPWLALPPLLAISRCFSALIAAKPRFFGPVELKLLDPAMPCLLFSDCEARINAGPASSFTRLIKVKAPRRPKRFFG